MRSRRAKMHYAGALRVKTLRGGTLFISPGFAACCTGARTRAIRANGNHTFDAAAVTCGACRALLRKTATPGATDAGESDGTK